MAFIRVCLFSFQETLDLNIPDEDGNTALMYACAMGYSAIAKIILDNYAMRQHSIDITIVNKDGLTALQLAAEREYTDILTMFADTFGVKNWHSAQALIEETRNEKPPDKLTRSKHALTPSSSGKQNSDRFYNMRRELKEAQRRETELDAEGIRLRTYDIHHEDEDYLNNNTPRFDSNAQRYDGNTPRYDNVQQRESRSQLKESFRRDKSSSRIDKPRLDTPLPKSRRTSEAGCIADSKKEFKENRCDSVVKDIDSVGKTMEYSPKPPDTPRCVDASGGQGVNGAPKSNSQSSRFLRSNWSNYRDPLPGINGSVVTSQADVIKLPPIRNAVMARGNHQRPIKLHSLDQNVWRTGAKFISENENSGNRQQQNSAFENEENS